MNIQPESVKRAKETSPPPETPLLQDGFDLRNGRQNGKVTSHL
jgi:hypothetical protein